MCFHCYYLSPQPKYHLLVHLLTSDVVFLASAVLSDLRHYTGPCIMPDAAVSNHQSLNAPVHSALALEEDVTEDQVLKN